jgi:hypothetical protein
VIEYHSSAGRVLPKTIGGWTALQPASRGYWALNNVTFMAALVVQFGIGMAIDLFVGITRHHHGTGASNLLTGAFDSVTWAVLHGPILLTIHALIGLGVAIHSIHNLMWNVRWGTRGSTWAAGIGALFVWAAALNGGRFLTTTTTSIRC